MFNKAPYYAPPRHLLESLDRYAVHGVETGGFLRAVLENDLASATGHMNPAIADFMILRELVMYVHNELPGRCHGSPGNVQRWIEQRRNQGPLAAAAAELEGR